MQRKHTKGVNVTAFIFNSDRVCVSQSHNLAGVFNWARRTGGVSSIHVYKLNEGSNRPGALVRVIYRTGHFAETYFVSGSHAAEWAVSRSNLGRNSWFSGCGVSVVDVAPGTWHFEREYGAPITFVGI